MIVSNASDFAVSRIRTLGACSLETLVSDVASYFANSLESSEAEIQAKRAVHDATTAGRLSFAMVRGIPTMRPGRVQG